LNEDGIKMIKIENVRNGNLKKE